MKATDEEIEDDTGRLAPLMAAQHHAAKALNLRGNVAYFLEKLCGLYDGPSCEGEMIVWATHETLADQVNCTAGTAGRITKQLISMGLIARCSRTELTGDQGGKFGYDLSPLVRRRAEFANIIRPKAQEIRTRAHQDAEISQLRIAIRGTLDAALCYEWRNQTYELSGELAWLEQNIPHRHKPGDRGPVLAALRDLRQRVEMVFSELERDL